MVMSLPTTASTANYKLLAGDSYYKSRSGKVAGIVLHITAGLEDLGMSGADNSAEGTNKWALNSGVDASWHAIADTGGVILCIPDWYTAWQAKGYNSNTVGIEISKRTTDWTKVSDKWRNATIKNVAKWCAAIVKKHKIPLKLSSKAAVDSAIKNGTKFGFTYHSRLSTNRSDPGNSFPIELLFKYIRAELEPGTTTPSNKFPLPSGHWFGRNDDTPSSHSGVKAVDQPHIKRIQAKVKAAVDGKFGPATETAVIKWQKANIKLLSDGKANGKVGRITWDAMF